MAHRALAVAQPDSDDAAAPATNQLRQRLLDRFGVVLPGVRFRPASERALSMVIDGTRLPTYPVPEGRLRLRLGERRGKEEKLTAVPFDWFGTEVWLDSQEPAPDAADAYDAGLLANVFALHHLLRRLDQFIDLRTLEQLKLDDLKPAAPVLAMLRILAADRTQLQVNKALHEHAASAAAKEVSPLGAAEAYRALPETRPLLWGVGDGHVGLQLDDDEEDLATE